MAKNTIISKYFGKPPKTVKTVLDATKNGEVNITEDDVYIRATIKLSEEGMPDGMTAEKITEVNDYISSVRAAAAVATANLKEKNPDKKATVKVTVPGGVEIDGTIRANGNVLLRTSRPEDEDVRDYLNRVNQATRELFGKTK